MKKTIKSHLGKVEDGGSKTVLTKDKAYVAAGSIVQHFKDLKGADKTHFLSQHFAKVWKEHDDDFKNYIELPEAEAFFNDLIDCDE